MRSGRWGSMVDVLVWPQHTLAPHWFGLGTSVETFRPIRAWRQTVQSFEKLVAPPHEPTSVVCEKWFCPECAFHTPACHDPSQCLNYPKMRSRSRPACFNRCARGEVCHVCCAVAFIASHLSFCNWAKRIHGLTLSYRVFSSADGTCYSNRRPAYASIPAIAYDLPSRPPLFVVPQFEWFQDRRWWYFGSMEWDVFYTCAKTETGMELSEIWLNGILSKSAGISNSSYPKVIERVN